MAKNDGLKELGSTGLNISAGVVDEDIVPELRSDRALKIFGQMSGNDPVIGGILFAIDMLIRQVEWTVEPNPSGNEEDAEFLQGCMDDMSHSWSDFISEVMTMLAYGFSFFEIVYKVRRGEQDEMGKVPTSRFDDGRIGWRKFGIRSQDSLSRWDYDVESGSLRGFIQRAAPEYEEVMIPVQKGLLFRTSVVKNNPEGRSILRNAYRPWYFKKHMEEIEGVGIERDLAGLPMAKVDAAILREASDLSNGDPSARNLVEAIRTIIKNVRQDKEAGIIWPMMKDQGGNDLLEFTLMNSGGSRTFDISGVIERYDSRIAMTVLADFILLGHQQVGSFSLSRDKTNLFMIAIGAWLQSIEEVLNRFAVHRLFRVNGMDTSNLPKIIHKPMLKPDLNTLSSFLNTLASMGMSLFPDENLDKYLREIADLPEQSEESKEAQEAKEQEELMGLVQQYVQEQQAAEQEGAEQAPQEDAGADQQPEA